ncbi:MAG: hypothetical protein ABSH44_13435 [Bryobacteraceae bacterium]|jgi:hypothetical protein
MPEPNEAYRAGYEKGRHDNIADAVADAFFGMLRDDPGGYYAAGYCDGARGRPFKVHGSKDATKPARKPNSPSLPSPLESQWYALCDGLEFIPKEIVDRFVGALNAAGSQVAAVIGLSPFTSHTCPRCGRSGHFRIHFLGRLTHPGACGWEGYMKTGSYIGHQIAQVFHTGIRAGGAMKDEADKKPDRSGSWMQGVLGFLFAAVFRAFAAVVLIPLHTIVALCQSEQAKSDIVTRVIVLAVFAAAAGIGVYQARQADIRTPVQQTATSPGTRPIESPASPQPAPAEAVPPAAAVEPLAPDNAQVIEIEGLSFQMKSCNTVPAYNTSPKVQCFLEVTSARPNVLVYVFKIHATDHQGREYCGDGGMDVHNPLPVGTTVTASFRTYLNCNLNTTDIPETVKEFEELSIPFASNTFGSPSFDDIRAPGPYRDLVFKHVPIRPLAP